MKAVICVLLACVLAVAQAQTLPSGSSRGGSTGMSSMFSSGGGMPNQMLYMAALGGNEQARLMLQCSMMNLPLVICMRMMA